MPKRKGNQSGKSKRKAAKTLENGKEQSNVNDIDREAIRQNRGRILNAVRRRVLQPWRGLCANEEVAEEILQTLVTTSGTPNTESVVLIGPSGSGKTSAVERGIAKTGEGAVAVRLDGRMHTSESTGLAEMARQLCNQLGQTYGRTSYDNNAGFVEEVASRLKANNRPVGLVLEGVDEFARQQSSLLYRVAEAGVAIVATSVRHDALESLEKRARSRLGHRHVDLSGLGTRLAGASSSDNLNSDACRRVLENLADVSSDESVSPSATTAFKELVRTAAKDASGDLSAAAAAGATCSHLGSALIRALHDSPEGLLEGDGLGKEVRRSVHLDGSRLDEARWALGNAPPLEVAFAVAALRLHIFREMSEFSFAKLYEEYLDCMGAKRPGKEAYSRQVCLRVFGRMIEDGTFERCTRKSSRPEEHNVRLPFSQKRVEAAVSSNERVPAVVREALKRERTVA